MKRNIFFLISAILLVGCGKKTAPPEPPALRPVYTVKVKTPSAEITRSFSGRVAAAESSDVAFQVGGRIIQVVAKAGEQYGQGDLLAKIDATDIQVQVDEADARLKEARNNLSRTQSLFENGNASKSTLDSVMTAEQAARGAFDTAKKRLTDCSLLMPYNGVIGRVNVNVQETVGAGQAVMTILANGEVSEFEIGVPADLIEQFRLNMPGKIEIGAFEDEVIDGTVSEIGAAPENNTTYPVSLRFASIQTGMREGMDGEVRVSLPNPEGEVLTIPLACVAAQPGAASYVYRVAVDASGAQGTLERQEVQTGSIRENGRVEILEGLKEGDVIVSRGVHRLEPGTTVLLREELQGN